MKYREELDAISMKYLTDSRGILYVADIKNAGCTEPMPPWDEWGKALLAVDDLNCMAVRMKNFLMESSDTFFLTFEWLQGFRKKLILLIAQLLDQNHIFFP